MGVVFLVTLEGFDRVRVGFDDNSAKEIISEYKKTFGDEMNVLLFHHDNAHEVDQKFQEKFQHCHINNQLYRKSNLQEYIDFLTNTCA